MSSNYACHALATPSYSQAGASTFTMNPLPQIDPKLQRAMEYGKSSGQCEPFGVQEGEKHSDKDVCETSSVIWESASKKRRLLGPEGPPCRSSISPPPKRNAALETKDRISAGKSRSGKERQESDTTLRPTTTKSDSNPQATTSPIQLSTVNGLPAASNIDTVSLRDILGNPLIKECWLFNYLFDVDFIMY